MLEDPIHYDVPVTISETTEDKSEEEDIENMLVGIADFGVGGEIPAKLYQNKIQVIIKTITGNVESTKIYINLCGVINFEILPHPACQSYPKGTDELGPEMPSTLYITYMSDLFNPRSITTILFTSTRKEITAFASKIDSIIKTMRSRLSFRVPNPRKLQRAHSDRSAGESLFPDNPQIRASKRATERPSKVLSYAEIDALRLSLPYRYKTCKWALSFSTDVDGVSLSTAITKCQKAPHMMLILAEDHSRIGAFLPDGLKDDKRFYGTGETFVFSFSPLLSVYQWTHGNEFFTASSRRDIAVGSGGKGGAAIYVSESMEKCFTDFCDTFGSPPLCAKSHFRILRVELWRLHA